MDAESTLFGDLLARDGLDETELLEQTAGSLLLSTSLAGDSTAITSSVPARAGESFDLRAVSGSHFLRDVTALEGVSAVGMAAPTPPSRSRSTRSLQRSPPARDPSDDILTPLVRDGRIVARPGITRSSSMRAGLSTKTPSLPKSASTSVLASRRRPDDKPKSILRRPDSPQKVSRARFCSPQPSSQGSPRIRLAVAEFRPSQAPARLGMEDSMSDATLDSIVESKPLPRFTVARPEPSALDETSNLSSMRIGFSRLLTSGDDTTCILDEGGSFFLANTTSGSEPSPESTRDIRDEKAPFDKDSTKTITFEFSASELALARSIPLPASPLPQSVPLPPSPKPTLARRSSRRDSPNIRAGLARVADKKALLARSSSKAVESYDDEFADASVRFGSSSRGPAKVAPKVVPAPKLAPVVTAAPKPSLVKRPSLLARPVTKPAPPTGSRAPLVSRTTEPVRPRPSASQPARSSLVRSNTTSRLPDKTEPRPRPRPSAIPAPPSLGSRFGYGGASQAQARTSLRPLRLSERPEPAPPSRPSTTTGQKPLRLAPRTSASQT